MSAVIIGIILPLAGTMLGSAFVFFMRKKIPDGLQKTLLGFASGVMVAASVWSLLIPSIEMMTHSSALTGTSPNLGEELNSTLTLGGELWNVIPAAVGFLAGMGFLLLIDELTPHLHLGAQKAEGPRRSSLAPPCWPSPSPSTTCPKVWLWGWCLRAKHKA